MIFNQEVYITRVGRKVKEGKRQRKKKEKCKQEMTKDNACSFQPI